MPNETVYRQHWGEWRRGAARLRNDGDTIELEPPIERYRIAEEPDLLFDLAGLTTAADAVPFARRYGLLQAAPDSDSPLEERWPAWEPDIVRLRLVLLVLHDLQAVRANRMTVAELRERWLGVLRAWVANLDRHEWDHDFEPSTLETDDGAMLRAAGEYVAWWINAWLAVNRTEARVVPTAQGFRTAADADSLLGYAYHRLAALAASDQELTRCRGCGRVFARRHGNEQYHDALCAQRGRAQRHYRKTKEGSR